MNTSVLIFLVVCLCLPFLGVGLVVLLLLRKRWKARRDIRVLEEWRLRDEEAP